MMEVPDSTPTSTEAQPDDEATDGYERPSKTQRKKEMHALQSLGQELVALGRDQLAQVELPQELREAIAFAHRVTSHEGRRRHMQYIGKLMRQVDADEIRAAIGRATGESRAAVALMHLAERWRDRLLADDEALTAFMSERPGADVQWLRAAIRAARREHAAGQPPKHARALYRWLHDQLSPHPSNDDAHEG
jgi:ribosome-associated protein